MSTITIRFEVLDMHPGRGRKRSCVHGEEIECEESNGFYPDAGKHYRDLMRKWNGENGMLDYNLSRARYDIRYYRVGN